MMQDDQFVTAVASLVDAAEKYRDALSADRVRAEEYYDGVMKDMPGREGWSQAVSKDVHSTINKALPSVMRTFFGSEVLAEFLPAGRDDEPRAQQVTEYVNMVVVPEAKIERAVHDAIFDAMKLRNGILTAYYDKRARIAVSDHTGLDEMSLAALVGSDDVEVLEQRQETPSETPGDDMAQPIGPTWAVRIKRKIQHGEICTSAVPLEEFLIHPDALSIDDSLLVGRWREIPRSQLVAMGYDRKQVMEFAASGDSVSDGERLTRRPDAGVRDEKADPANELVDYYQLYVRLDYDDDGIAELRRVCFAGGFAVENMLENEYADDDDIPFYDVVSKRKPHQWEGHSLSDEIIDIQRIKTALLRYTMDNIYWQNTLQPIIDGDAIANVDAIYKPEFGRPIITRGGRPINEILQWRQVPFVGQYAMELLGYWNEQVKERTGLSDASSGLPPDALQNVTAKASALLEQAGINHVEMMTRTLAHSLRRFFKGILKLVIKHQDKVRTVRLRDDWADIDPRQWNADMDVMINTGLGAGTRERDMMMMQVIMSVQKEIIAAFGKNNPMVTPQNIYQSVEKLIQAAGMKGVNTFITKPTEEQMQAFVQQMAQEPNPEMVKVQGAMELEKIKTEAAINREKAQMEADVAVKQKEAENDFALENLKASNTLMIEREKIALEREKATMEHGLRKEEAGMKGEAEIFKAKLDDEKKGGIEGKPKSKSAEHSDKFDAMAETLMAFMKSQTARKRVVRNKDTGDIEGVEPVFEDAA